MNNNDEKSPLMEMLEKEAERNNTIANQIAKSYLQKHPRTQSHPVHMTSSEDASELFVYFPLDDTEKSIIRKAKQQMEEYGGPLDEFLRSESPELYEKLSKHESPLTLNIIQDVNLENALSFCSFKVQAQKEDDSLDHERIIRVPLSDDEYAEILSVLIITQNRYSFNQLMAEKTEIASHITGHIIHAYYDFVILLDRPFLCEMEELKQVAKSIMNPQSDALNLFASDDAEIKKFMEKKTIK